MKSPPLCAEDTVNGVDPFLRKVLCKNMCSRTCKMEIEKNSKTATCMDNFLDSAEHPGAFFKLFLNKDLL